MFLYQHLAQPTPEEEEHATKMSMETIVSQDGFLEEVYNMEKRIKSLIDEQTKRLEKMFQNTGEQKQDTHQGRRRDIISSTSSEPNQIAFDEMEEHVKWLMSS